MDERKSYITWGQYFMGIARLSAMRSKDPNTQVGACIVDKGNRILSMGYNGMPRGCADKDFPWARVAESDLETKYPYVVHAELNAILNYRGGGTLEGSTLYVTMFPCNECAKAIIQSGIRKVVYEREYYSSEASRRMLEAAGVECEKHGEAGIGLVHKDDAVNVAFDASCVKCMKEHADKHCDVCRANQAMDGVEAMECEL